jgi:non-ribosomal peptide synthase protein (TIGR01720 family)
MVGELDGRRGGGEVSEGRAPQLRARVEALSDAQRQSLAERLGASHARDATRLVGFLVADATSPPTDAELRGFLAERLPDYMIPSRFVTLPRLPRTAAGKLDRHALAHAVGVEVTSEAPGRAALAPRTAIEAKLAAIWKDVLKLDDVGVDDDFFEIGGDSLLSIRVIARAGREGIRIAPERFFERPTIAHIAASIDAAVASSPRGPLADPTGDAPLTPIQHWFLDAVPTHRDRWNQSYLLELGHSLDPVRLGAIVGELCDHHDALRLRLACRDGHWRQDVTPPNAAPPFRVVDLRSVSTAERSVRVDEECEREHASLRLEEGRLFRCVYFEGDAGWRRVFLIGHHLVLDSVSWNVILEDLATMVAQAVDGQPPRLPDRTASARAWAIALAEEAAKPAISTAATHWLAMPADGAAGSAGCNRDAGELTVTLGIEESRLLLQEAPRRMDASVQAILLSALLVAWRDWTGGEALRLDVEGHGRDVLGDALDVSRTVGWFTTVFPVRLSLTEDAGNGGTPSIAAIVGAVQTTLDALPRRGAAHGLARYLSPDESVRVALAAQPRPWVLFNHLGTHDLALPTASGLQVVDEPQGRARSLDAPRPYVIEINTRVERGTLIARVEYSRQAYSDPAADRFATAFRSALVAVAHGSSAVGFSGVDASSLAIVAELLAELDET